ncbi:MAG: fimbria/pilus outer membrane usher protein [Burkholderiaceae bacterium]
MLRILPLLLPALLGAGSAMAAELPPDIAALAAARPQIGETLLLGLSINGVLQEQTLRAVRVQEGLAVPQQIWDELHLRLPLLAPRVIDGESYVVLGRDADWQWQIEEASQTLLITASAAAFRSQRMEMQAEAMKVTAPAGVGAFVNYDLQWQHRQSGSSAGNGQAYDAFLEAGLYLPWGDANSTALYRHDGSSPARFVRLDTRWQMDDPQAMNRLIVGDSIGQPGAWGRAVRFGGLQWGTDFSLRPGFLSFPLPTLRGEATLPSTMDIYVNNSQRLQGRLQPGAFDITDLPVVTGQGEIRTVVRDLLGREQVVVQPYYVSPQLLKPGLRDYSIELGALRQDYGVRSDRYGRALLSATERRGLSDSFTREFRAELMGAQQTLGASGIWLWPRLGTGVFSLAASHDRAQGAGWLAGVALDRQSQDWSGSVQLRRASAHFAQIGQSAGSAPGTSIAAAMGRSWSGQSAGISYLRQISGGQPARLLSLNYGLDLGAGGYLGLYFLRDLNPRGGNTLALGWSRALDARTSASASLVRNQQPDGLGRSQQLQLQVQQNPLLGAGFGYQLMAESGGRQVAQAQWQNDRVQLNGGAARQGSTRELRAGAAGGIAWMDGSSFASRRIEGGFALVEVADYPDVRVWRDQQVVAHTDSRGRAFVTGLRGYQANRVGVSASDLPYDAQLEALEVQLTPAARSAARLSFPVQRSLAASFRIVDAQGQPLPPGSQLQVLGQDRVFPVGLEGRAYVAGLDGKQSTLQARWTDGSCQLRIDYPPNAEDLPDLGTLVCR